MEELKSTPVLKFNDNQLCDVRRAFGYEDVNRLKQDIEQLDDWIKKQNHFKVKDFDREYMERMLIFNKGSIERAKQRLDKLFTCTNLMPEFLQNFDIKNEFIPCFNVVHTCLLPTVLKDNYRVLISSLRGNDDSKFDILDYYRYFILFGHYVLNNDYCLGYEVIGDTRNVTIGNITKLNPVIVHKGLTLIIDAMGVRLKKIHLLSGNKFLDIILTLLKQSMSAKLRERIVVHTSIESLYEYIPREHLPKDFGGHEKSIKELHDINFKELSTDSHRATVEFMEKATTDESLRLVSDFNEVYSGMPGSFKILCVD